VFGLILRAWSWNIEILADLDSEVFVDLAVPRYGRSLTFRRVHVNRVSAALALEHATMLL
jgi:hypothetical protein